jgi:hypothetical protein
MKTRNDLARALGLSLKQMTARINQGYIKLPKPIGRTRSGMLYDDKAIEDLINTNPLKRTSAWKTKGNMPIPNSHCKGFDVELCLWFLSQPSIGHKKPIQRTDKPVKSKTVCIEEVNIPYKYPPIDPRMNRSDW